MRSFLSFPIPWEQDPEAHPRFISGREIPWDTARFVFNPETGRFGQLQQHITPDKKSEKVNVGKIRDPHVHQETWHLTFDTPVLSFAQMEILVKYARDHRVSLMEALVVMHGKHPKVTASILDRWKAAPKFYPPDVAHALNTEHGLVEEPKWDLEKEKAKNERLKARSELARLKAENAALELEASGKKR